MRSELSRWSRDCAQSALALVLLLTLSACGVHTDSAGTSAAAPSSAGCAGVGQATGPAVAVLLAGSLCALGSTDGTASAALFNGATGLSVDGNNIIYVADTGSSTVRTIAPPANASAPYTVATLAGTAPTLDANGKIVVTNEGFEEGAVDIGRMFYPAGLASDSAGNVFVADTNNCAIRKIPASAGSPLSTYAGSPPVANVTGTICTGGLGDGSPGGFSFPTGAAVDAAGNVYVADDANCEIRKIAVAGGGITVTTVAGAAGAPTVAGASCPLAVGTATAIDGSAAAATFGGPQSVAIDPSGTVLYVADDTDNNIRAIDLTAGTVSTLAGPSATAGIVAPGTEGYANGFGTAAVFDTPSGIAVDPANGNVYVADTCNNAIRKIVPSTGQVSTIASGGLLVSPTGVAIFGTTLYATVGGVGVCSNNLNPTGSAVVYISNFSTY